MIQEYLFTNDEHRKAVEQYIKDISEGEIRDIENTECWIVTFFKEGQSGKAAKALSIVNDYVVSNFRPIVLSDGCSAYYNKDLYQPYNEFERKLRKLLYLKSALSQDAKDSDLIKDLEKKDFGKIFELLFSDDQFVNDVKASIKEKTWKFTKTEIITAIQELSENTLWDRLIGKDAVPLLRSDFVRVKSYRNDIMHAHSMNTSDHDDAKELIQKINTQLDDEIGKIIDVKEEINDDGTYHFNTTFSDAIRNMNEAQMIVNNWQEQISGVQSALSAVKRNNLVPAMAAYAQILESPVFNAVQQLTSSPQWDSIQKSFQDFSQFQNELREAQKSLQAFTSNTELLRKSQS